jgi:hypothetical protein
MHNLRFENVKIMHLNESKYSTFVPCMLLESLRMQDLEQSQYGLETVTIWLNTRKNILLNSNPENSVRNKNRSTHFWLGSTRVDYINCIYNNIINHLGCIK